jgi:hypothetical protein
LTHCAGGTSPSFDALRLLHHRRHGERVVRHDCSTTRPLRCARARPPSHVPLPQHTLKVAREPACPCVHALPSLISLPLGACARRGKSAWLSSTSRARARCRPKPPPPLGRRQLAPVPHAGRRPSLPSRLASRWRPSSLSGSWPWHWRHRRHCAARCVARDGRRRRGWQCASHFLCLI